MNTGEGFFFGSEIYRYLKSWRDRAGKFWRFCDFCGSSCEYWSSELRTALQQMEIDSLSQIYEQLLARHPEIDVLVDGSKTIPGENDSQPEFVIVSTKHPVRLLASQVYNRRERYGIVSERLDLVGEQIERSLDEYLPFIAYAANRFRKRYASIFASCPDAFVFRADEAHRENFRAFRVLEHHLGVSVGTFDPDNFAKYPSHTLGGNRVPIWMTRQVNGHPPPRDERTRYYAASPRTGDWKLDDKYQRIFRPATLDAISSLPSYSSLCELLQYDPQPSSQYRPRHRRPRVSS